MKEESFQEWNIKIKAWLGRLAEDRDRYGGNG